MVYRIRDNIKLDGYIQGSAGRVGEYHIISNITARNAIPIGQRTQGLRARTQVPPAVFELSGGITDGYWSLADPVDYSLNQSTLSSVHNLYVYTSGNDESGDGTQSNPFRQIQRALDALPNGFDGSARIWVGPGEFRDFTNTRLIRGRVDIIASTENPVLTSSQISSSVPVVSGKSVRATCEVLDSTGFSGTIPSDKYWILDDYTSSGFFGGFEGFLVDGYTAPNLSVIDNFFVFTDQQGVFPFESIIKPDTSTLFFNTGTIDGGAHKTLRGSIYDSHTVAMHGFVLESGFTWSISNIAMTGCLNRGNSTNFTNVFFSGYNKGGFLGILGPSSDVTIERTLTDASGDIRPTNSNNVAIQFCVFTESAILRSEQTTNLRIGFIDGETNGAGYINLIRSNTLQTGVLDFDDSVTDSRLLLTINGGTYVAAGAGTLTGGGNPGASEAMVTVRAGAIATGIEAAADGTLVASTGADREVSIGNLGVFRFSELPKDDSSIGPSSTYTKVN